MRTGTFRGFEVTLHDPGIAVILFNRPERLNGTTAHVKRDLVAELTFAQALDEIATKTAISDHHPDAVEGMQAFREKRAPRFNQPSHLPPR